MNSIDTRSSFQQVADMNNAFGNPQGNYHRINGNKLQSQCKNIVKEYEELMTALGEGNLYKIRDALCDIQVFAMGAQHLMGVDGDRDMRSVVDAVMTRFCTTPERLSASQAHFRSLGVEFYVEGEYPQVCLKSSKDQGYTEGNPNPEYPKGKFLKAVGYTEPTFYEPAPVVEPVARKFMGMENPIPAAAIQTPVRMDGAHAVDAALPPVVAVVTDARINDTPLSDFGGVVPPVASEVDIVAAMMVQRATEQGRQQFFNDMINAAVKQFRGELEKLVHGFEPFDETKNNTTAISKGPGV